MASLETSYLGIALKNPLVVASSSLTATLSGIRKAADQGVGAIVLKSLFEEQLQSEIDKQKDELDIYSHPEANDYLQQMGMNLGPRAYLDLIADAKKVVSVPIIASVNCTSGDWWVEFAKQLQSAGADALEINIGIMPQSEHKNSGEIETYILKLVESVRKHTTLPLAVKLGSSFTSLTHLTRDIAQLGVQGLVLFNRYYQIDINLDKLSLQPGVIFSNPQDYYQSLRWIALLYKRVSCDLVAAGGVHDADAALRLILSGAQTVQICSTIYKHGYGAIQTMLTQMSAWLDKKNFPNLNQIRGLLCQKESESPERYERLQYIKALTGMY